MDVSLALNLFMLWQGQKWEWDEVLSNAVHSPTDPTIA